MDLSKAGAARTLVASRPDVIFHLAAIVSGEAEQEFEKGYAVNLDAAANCLRRSGSKAHGSRIFRR